MAALFEQLRLVFPYVGRTLALLDTDRQAFTVRGIDGYPERVRDYFHTSAMYGDIDAIGLNRQRPPMRLRDLPIPPSELPVWADYLEPAGFREGIAIGLFGLDGSHLGLLMLHTDDPRTPDDATRDFLGTLAPVIANAVDPMRSIAPVARVIANARAGVLLTRAGKTHPLPGLSNDHPLVRPGSAVFAALSASLNCGHSYPSFLAVHGRTLFRITALACPPEVPRHLRAMVLVSPSGELHGLTRRELEILGLLTEGRTNAQIARSAYIAERTVATHLEHILAKLRASSRTLAAVRALRLGLYIPPQLHGRARLRRSEP
ncbi:LuxR C-terminal-related transcriptional regulator [Plantactinospora sp. KBS50]|uniref:helix-turn-helix transcriptional regulator n=1 Tax=Plantactinospora sp. KBS50 TaxID=2024580 RepID=UPI0012FD6ACD|nr:LuxR C-terminal-related transcriptional regulator [Plantactinospora sp. KBS50]